MNRVAATLAITTTAVLAPITYPMPEAIVPVALVIGLVYYIARWGV